MKKTLDANKLKLIAILSILFSLLRRSVFQ